MHVYGGLHNTTDMSKIIRKTKKEMVSTKKNSKCSRDLRSYSVYSGGNMQKSQTRAGEEGETDKHVKKKS